MSYHIANLIDHTLLKADATKGQIVKLAEEAKQYEFATVCVNPVWVKTAHQLLKGTPVKVCTVIGFPLGASTTEVKVMEARNALENGAEEIDMVIHIGALKDKDYDLVERDIKSVVAVCKPRAITKVIIETSLLSEEEKVKACMLAVRAGADFVKTSTGFSTGGAVKEDVQLMRKAVGPDIGVKASGGIRDLQDLLEMIKAGATRIGTSSGVAIMKGEHSNSQY